MLQYANHILNNITFPEWAGFFAVAAGIILWDKLWNAMIRALGHGRTVSFHWANKLLLIYVAFILLITLFTRETGSGGQMAWVPLWSWQRVLIYRNFRILWQILLNILLFVPFGGLLALRRHRSTKRMVLAGFGLSLCIELCQLVFQLGLFEWDDILHNGVGCALGVFVVKISRCIVKQVEK